MCYADANADANNYANARPVVLGQQRQCKCPYGDSTDTAMLIIRFWTEGHNPSAESKLTHPAEHL